MTIREFLVKTGCLPNLAGFDYLIRAVEIVKELNWEHEISGICISTAGIVNTKKGEIFE